MVKKAKRAPLPWQDDRAKQQLQDAVEGYRREDANVARLIALTQLRVADAAPSDTSSATLYNGDKPVTVKRAIFFCETAESADATDYATVSLYAYDTKKTTLRLIAELKTNRIALYASRPAPLTIKSAEVPAGASVVWRVTKSGAGRQLGDHSFFLELEEKS